MSISLAEFYKPSYCLPVNAALPEVAAESVAPTSTGEVAVAGFDRQPDAAMNSCGVRNGGNMNTVVVPYVPCSAFLVPADGDDDWCPRELEPEQFRPDPDPVKFAEMVAKFGFGLGVVNK